MQIMMLNFFDCVCDFLTALFICFGVSTYEAFVAFANDPYFASSRICMSIVMMIMMIDCAYLRIPNLTTERTTAFMPALSSPEVRMAIFIDSSIGISKGVRDGQGVLYPW